METLKLVELINKNSGFTIDLKTGNIPKSGYCIALSLFEQITDVNNNDLELILSDYIKSKPILFTTLPEYYLGAWVNNGKIYLDVVTIVKDLKVALRLAKIGKQIAIFDLDNQKEIFINNLVFAESNDKLFTGNYTDKSDLFNLIEACYKSGFDFVGVNDQVFSLPVQKCGTDYQRKSDRHQVINGLVNHICKR